LDLCQVRTWKRVLLLVYVLIVGGKLHLHQPTLSKRSAGTPYKRSVTEKNAGPGGPDTCWFSNSAADKYESINPGTGTVNSNNQYGDLVGWFPDKVTYYRSQGRAPFTEVEDDYKGGRIHSRVSGLCAASKRR
jgi:hypothetical protein